MLREQVTRCTMGKVLRSSQLPLRRLQSYGMSHRLLSVPARFESRIEGLCHYSGCVVRRGGRSRCWWLRNSLTTARLSQELGQAWHTVRPACHGSIGILRWMDSVDRSSNCIYVCVTRVEEMGAQAVPSRECTKVDRTRQVWLSRLLRPWTRISWYIHCHDQDKKA
ncbi:uncharacterized protein K460DRAFT_155620 [Cucurbitaria berberidis CBS 394.84]|uniref:Uncharacterized protein n=1 Tax=Cucurbitaria berberidis CBS 394.84 TaxID=1168544 RepID=A0A9P4L6N5_9PLEO|nr:uncharacterized protein K460DRAFT_155620 [Cucurbitaria berberidis CBS 394.84]KAF1843995.1 hypothetical protein K460DRAFT_155620 [Cucurbitaria berberidis CBS 394.84]